MILLGFRKRIARSGISVILVFLSCAADLGAACGDDSSPSVRTVADPDPVDDVDPDYELTIRYFQQLDNLIAGFHADVARETPEKLAELVDELLASILEDVPIVYFRAYLAREIPRADPAREKWLQRLFDRVNELRALDMHSEAASELIRESVRTRRVSTLLVCFTLFRGKERAEVAETLAHFQEPRVVRHLCKALAAASGSPPGISDGGWPLHNMFRNAAIKSLATLTGLDLPLVRPLPHGMRDGEDPKQFSARFVACIREGSHRCLDAAAKGVQWLRINEPRAAAMFEADCTDAPAESRPLTADAWFDADSFALQRIVYFRVIDNLVIVRTEAAAAAAPETAVQQADDLLSEIVEDVPMVYVRAYLKRLIPQIRAESRKQLHQRLLDRLDAIRAMDRASARALVADCARQRRVSTLLVCLCAFRDPSSRGEAAKALASFKEPRVVHCLCTALAVMARCAPARGADEGLDDVALQNAMIRSLSTLTELNLEIIGPPSNKMHDGEDEKAFSARVVAARCEATDRCIDAVKRCEQWLDKNRAPH